MRTIPTPYYAPLARELPPTGSWYNRAMPAPHRASARVLAPATDGLVTVRVKGVEWLGRVGLASAARPVGGGGGGGTDPRR